MTKVKNRRPLREYLKDRLKNVPVTVIMSLFVAFCIASIIYFIIIGQYRDIPIALAYMAIVFVFYLAEYSLNVKCPLGYVIFMMLFVLFCFLGASYNFYGKITHLDDILHSAWGIVFSVVGIILVKSLIGAPENAKGVIACILFGIGFTMLLSVVWEIYEYTGDSLLHTMDMQQDTIVRHFHSFLLHEPYDNLHTVEIDNITKTVIYYGNGQTLELDGYLDLGLIDTMHDLIWCFGTTVVFSIILAIDWCKGKYLYRFLIPAIAGEKYDKRGKLLKCAQAESDAVAEEETQPAETQLEAENGQGKEADESVEQQPAPEEESQK